MINFSPLFVHQVDSTLPRTFDVLLSHLQSLVCPQRQLNETAKARAQRKELVQSLMMNKYEEKIKKQSAEEALIAKFESTAEAMMVDQPVFETVVVDGIVRTEYLSEKVGAIMQEIESRPSGHFAISGP